MSDDTNPSTSPPSRVRRSSFAGQTFADLFGNGRPSMNRNSSEQNNNNTSPPTQQMPGPISQAAAQAQRRRLSLTTLGLSASPNQASPFGNGARTRNDSIGSANSGSIDESAIAEDDARETNLSSSPSSTPFQRRTSFGAKALRDIRTSSFTGQSGGGGSGQGSPGANGTKSSGTSTADKSSRNGTISSRDAKGRGSNEGFNWSDNLRSRAERTSISGAGGLSALANAGGHSRTKSTTVMEPPPVAPPKPVERPRPDHFQERILKGDFYMD